MCADEICSRSPAVSRELMFSDILAAHVVRVAFRVYAAGGGFVFSRRLCLGLVCLKNRKKKKPPSPVKTQLCE